MPLKQAMTPGRAFLVLSAGMALSQAVTFGTYVLFLDSLGLSPLQINLVNFAFFSSRFLLEVPTGAIADVFGRKASFVIACVLYAAGLALYWRATTFAGCILAEVVIAVGATCASGAFEAWMVDELAARGESAEVAGLLAAETRYDQLAMLVGAPLGSVAVMFWGLGSPWLLAAIGSALVGIAAIAIMRETRVTKRTVRAHRAIWDTGRTSMRYAISSGPVRVFIALGALWTLSRQAPNMQWSLLFGPYVGGGKGTGFMFAGIVACIFIGAACIPWLVRRRGERGALVVAVVVSGITMILTTLIPFAYSLIPFALFEVANGTAIPLKATALNHAIESDDRATVLSCAAMATYLGGAGGLLATGILAEYVSITAAWCFGGAACLSAAWMLIRSKGAVPQPAG